MTFDPEKYHRRSIRLHGYDYRESGYYFITICTEKRLCLFGEIKNNKMILNDLGKIIEEEWVKSEKIRPNVELNEFVVMPNHIHGIVVIKYKMEIGGRGVLQYARNDESQTDRGVYQYAPTPLQSPTQTIGSIVRGFKSSTAKRINIYRDFIAPVWQRNYYEHIIRNENEHNNISKYIALNPSMWDMDRNNIDGFH